MMRKGNGGGTTEKAQPGGLVNCNICSTAFHLFGPFYSDASGKMWSIFFLFSKGIFHSRSKKCTQTSARKWKEKAAMLCHLRQQTPPEHVSSSVGGPILRPSSSLSPPFRLLNRGDEDGRKENANFYCYLLARTDSLGCGNRFPPPFSWGISVRFSSRWMPVVVLPLHPARRAFV